MANRLRSWQFDPEMASVGSVGNNTGFAAYAFRRFSDNGEAYAGAFVFSFRMKALEHAEEPGLMLRFDADSVAAVKDLNTPARYAHPWFGPLDAGGWHALASGHLRIHRIQIERIIEG